MDQKNEYEILMQGGGQKELERSPPPSPSPTPERKKEDIPAHDPKPLTESEPLPDLIEPDKPWNRK